MTVFDSNAILRYILQDNEEMADTVEARIGEDDCCIPTEVIAEMVYVLSKVYHIPRQEISSAILGVLDIVNIQIPNREVVIKGLDCYSTTSLDFVDCLMVGYQYNGCEVFTFDEKLQKRLDRE